MQVFLFEFELHYGPGPHWRTLTLRNKCYCPQVRFMYAMCTLPYIYIQMITRSLSRYGTAGVAPCSAAQATLQQPEDAAQRIGFILMVLLHSANEANM